MGNTVSEQGKYYDALKQFNPEDKDNLTKLCNSLMAQNSHIIYEKYTQLIEEYLPTKLAERLYNESSKLQILPKEKKVLSEGAFVISLAHILKGDIFQKSHVIFKLASDKEKVNATEMVTVVQAFLSAYLSIVTKSPNIASWKLSENIGSEQRLALYLLNDLFGPDHSSEKTLPDKEYTQEDINKWLQSSVLSFCIINMVFNVIFPITPIDQISNTYPILPYCEKLDWSRFVTMLDLPSLIFLNSSIPLDYRNVWRLLYSTVTDGESFNRLLRNTVYAGPFLMLIHEKNGNIFGGFASTSLIFKSKFQGSTRSFVFSLTPNIRIYHPAGFNENYVYINCNQQTFPNTLAFGGQINYFGFCVDSDISTGHSTKCLTYESPILSKAKDFRIDAIEIWGVGPEPVERKAFLQKRISLLDLDPEAQAMLTLLNKGPLSEGMREDDPSRENPEIKNFRFKE